MAAFLFVWNPKKWNWTTLDQSVDQLEKTGQFSEKWSCQSHKSIREGDRAFLLRLGVEPKGIMGSGFVASFPFLSPHWSGEDKLVPRVIIDFDVLLHPDKTTLLGLDSLNQGDLSNQTWTPQASGISIQSDLVADLEKMWFDCLNTHDAKSRGFGDQGHRDQAIYSEGTQSRVQVTRYERNPHARQACIDHHGLTCVVCAMNFESVYGELGKGFIHVHHLRPVAASNGETLVDPVIDLRPVCPNCHAMLHRKSPPASIEDLVAQITPSKSH